MSDSELSELPRMEEFPSLPSATLNDCPSTVSDFASRCSPKAGPSPTQEIGVVIICLPLKGDWRADRLADRLVSRLRGIEHEDVVRTLSRQFDLHLGQARPRINGEAHSQAQDVTGNKARPDADDDRSVLTLLFTDIVGSTELVDQLGDGAWCELLKTHNAIVRAQLKAFGGSEIENTGDGFFASFDRPTRAVRCAESIRTHLEAVGITTRAAIHTAECETGEGCVSGVAVHVAARMVAVAAPGQIIVSNTVRELVAGSGLDFCNGKWHTLRGLRGRRQLFAVKQSPAGISTSLCAGAAE